MNDGAFQIPDTGFEDLTVHQLRARTADDREISLVIGRSRIPAGKSLYDVVSAQLKHEATELPGHAVLASEEVRVADMPGIDVRCRFRRGNEAYYARQIHLGAYDTAISFVMAGPMIDRDLCDAHLEEIAGSLRLREGD